MDEYEYDVETELSHEQEAVMELGLALDEAIEYIQDLLAALADICPRSVLRLMPDVIQAEQFLRDWSPEDDR